MEFYCLEMNITSIRKYIVDTDVVNVRRYVFALQCYYTCGHRIFTNWITVTSYDTIFFIMTAL